MHIARINPLNLMKRSGGHIPHLLAAFQHVLGSACIQTWACAKFLHIKTKHCFQYKQSCISKPNTSSPSDALPSSVDSISQNAFV